MRKRFLAFALSFLLLLGVTACDASDGTGSAQTSVWAVNSADKILQSYDTSTAAGAALEQDALSLRKQSVDISAFKNEYEGKQILFSTDKDISSYDVAFSDLTSGDKKIGKENFELYHEYYHEVETIYDSESKMMPGMYPDALIPLKDAKRLGYTAVKAGNTQGVYATVKVPKDAAAGTYTGTVTVTLDGKESTLPVSLRVFDYTLPDEVSLMSCIPLNPGYMFYGEADGTQAMYDKYVARLNKYRLSVQYLYPTELRAAEDKDDEAYILKEETDKAAIAAQNPAVSSYAIRVLASDANMGLILNEEVFYKYLRAYVDASMEHELNLFEKAYVYMGNIIDEPSGKSIERANYVCGQFDKVLAQAVTYARGKGADAEVIESLEKLPHVVTGAYGDGLTGPQSYCPTVDKLSSAAEIDRYRALRENNKSYWWYTCTVPKIPYPTIHLDDNGISARTMGWMAKEYDVDGYLTWESAYYMSMLEGGQIVTSNAVPVKGKDNYDNVHRWGDTFGDGFVFYPGAPLGIDGPVDSMRLPALRDGMEDYEALLDLEKKYAALGADASGVLDEIYATLYGSVKVLCTSEEVEAAHVKLGELLELANKGVAISEFTRQADGKITAKIFVPEGKTVTLNDFALTPDGGFATVSDSYTVFTVACDGAKASVPVPAASSVSFEAANIKLYNAAQEEQTTTIEGEEEITIVTNETSARISIDVSAQSLRVTEGAVSVRLYSDKAMTISLSFQGNTRNRLIDTFAVKAGWNTLRADRLQDIDLKTLGDLKFVNLTFASAGEQIKLGGITLYK